MAAGGALLVAGLSIRIALYFPIAAFPIDSDGVLAGLCALRIGHGHDPVFFPGGTRLGAASCYLAAAFFAWFGPGRAGLALTGLTWGALYLTFSWLFLRACLDRKTACAAFAFAAVPSAAFVTVTYIPWGYGEIVASCAATLWLAALWQREGRPWQRLCFGLSVGFGVWLSLQTLTIALPAFAWVALIRRGKTVRETPLAVLGAIAGAAPFWIGNVGRGFPSLTENWASRPASGLAQAWQNFVWAVTAPLPQLLFSGVAPGWSPSIAIVAGYALIAAGFAAALRRNSRDPDATADARRAGILVLAVTVCVVAFYAASAAGSVRGWTVRYVAPLYVVAPLACGIGARALWRLRRWLAVAAAAAILIPNLLLYSLPGSAARAALTAQLQTKARLRTDLERRDVRMAYGDYFDVYDLNLDARAKLAGIPAVAAFDYLDYGRMLPATGLRWALVARDPARLRVWADAAGARGSTATVGDLSVFVAALPAANTAELLKKLRGAPP